jgi:peptidyl-dipeptidase Dcp
MNGKTLTMTGLLSIALAWLSPPFAAQSSQTSSGGTANPLLATSPLPFQAPPFDKIKDGDFAPAFDAGMKEQRAEVQQITDSPAAPTVENTLVALERSGQTLARVNFAFNALTSANTNDDLQKLQEEVAPKLAAHQDAIFLNATLFGRVAELYKTRDRLRLDPESKRLIEYQYQQFVMGGATLSDEKKALLKKLNEEDATLEAKFTNQLLAGAKDAALVVSDATELDGLSATELAAAAEAAKTRGLDGKWLIPILNTTQQPALESLTNRATRERLYNASWTRNEHGDANDTRVTIARLAEIRAEKAKLLGQPSFAAWRLQDQMAKTPDQVQRFLDALVAPTVQKARSDAADLQALMDSRGGAQGHEQRSEEPGGVGPQAVIEDKQHSGLKLQPWDWNMYAEQVRKARFDLDVNDVKPYFELNRVLHDGVFYAAQELYGLTFKERKDLPVYQPDVRVFEVFDKGGAHLGLVYFDYFKRDNKNGGAWMDTLVQQSRLLGTQPVLYNVANFPKPAPGQPALISFDDVTTMFHEFGHALHGLFASQEYPSLSGTNVARDFVEFPSQFNEHWALDPKVFASYARHHETGAAMPEALAEKIKKAQTFNQGYALTELLAAAELDMAWHTLRSSAATKKDVDQFEAASLEKAHLNLPQVPPRYRSSYFLHIWANGYASGYYAYIWTEMLDDDAFAWFKEHGGMTAANGQRFRDLILSKGNTEDYGKMFRDFRGRDPDINAMLVQRGLKESGAAPNGTKASGTKNK